MWVPLKNYLSFTISKPFKYDQEKDFTTKTKTEKEAESQQKLTLKYGTKQYVILFFLKEPNNM